MLVLLYEQKLIKNNFKKYIGETVDNYINEWKTAANFEFGNRVYSSVARSPVNGLNDNANVHQVYIIYRYISA